jgi:ribonuclease BN (tRNA processing enzyme)
MNRYVAKKKANIIITRPYQDLLWNFSLKGGCGFNELKNKKELQFTDMWKPLRPVWKPGYERETFEYKQGTINIKMIRTMHFPEQAKSWQTSFYSSALLIDERVFFSGDTKYDPELIQDIEKRFSPEIIFHDAQFFTGGVHASVEELTALPAAIKKKMLLMHYQESWKSKIRHIKEAGFLDFAKQWYCYQFE